MLTHHATMTVRSLPPYPTMTFTEQTTPQPPTPQYLQLAKPRETKVMREYAGQILWWCRAFWFFAVPVLLYAQVSTFSMEYAPCIGAFVTGVFVAGLHYYVSNHDMCLGHNKLWSQDNTFGSPLKYVKLLLTSFCLFVVHVLRDANEKVAEITCDDDRDDGTDHVSKSLFAAAMNDRYQPVLPMGKIWPLLGWAASIFWLGAVVYLLFRTYSEFDPKNVCTPDKKMRSDKTTETAEYRHPAQNGAKGWPVSKLQVRKTEDVCSFILVLHCLLALSLMGDIYTQIQPLGDWYRARSSPMIRSWLGDKLEPQHGLLGIHEGEPEPCPYKGTWRNVTTRHTHSKRGVLVEKRKKTKVCEPIIDSWDEPHEVFFCNTDNADTSKHTLRNSTTANAESQGRRSQLAYVLNQRVMIIGTMIITSVIMMALLYVSRIKCNIEARYIVLSDNTPLLLSEIAVYFGLWSLMTRNVAGDNLVGGFFENGNQDTLPYVVLMFVVAAMFWIRVKMALRDWAMHTFPVYAKLQVGVWLIPTAAGMLVVVWVLNTAFGGVLNSLCSAIALPTTIWDALKRGWMAMTNSTKP